MTFRNEDAARRAYLVYINHGGRKPFSEWLDHNDFTYAS